MGILIIIGIAAILAGILSIPPLAEEFDLPIPGKWLRMVGLLALGIVLIFIKSLFMWADASTQYILLKPGGKIETKIDQQGIKWKGAAKVLEWNKFIDVRTPTGAEGEDLSQVEGLLAPVDIRFIDQVTGTVSLTTRFQLPADEVNFISLYKEFKTVSNLVSTTLLPTVREVVKNTGYMYAAQDYISGSFPLTYHLLF